MASRCARPGSVPGSTRTGLITPSTATTGMLAASTRPAVAPTVCAGSVANRTRADDASGPRSDVGRGQGAVSKELGRLEGVGEAGEVENDEARTARRHGDLA